MKIEHIATEEPGVRAYVFHTTAVEESVTFEEYLDALGTDPMLPGPEGWKPLELRVGEHFNVATPEDWFRTEAYASASREIQECCEQARSKTVTERNVTGAQRFRLIRVELRPATAERAVYRMMSPLEVAFDVPITSPDVADFLARERAAIELLQLDPTFDFVGWERAYKTRLRALLSTVVSE